MVVGGGDGVVLVVVVLVGVDGITMVSVVVDVGDVLWGGGGVAKNCTYICVRRTQQRQTFQKGFLPSQTLSPTYIHLFQSRAQPTLDLPAWDRPPVRYDVRDMNVGGLRGKLPVRHWHSIFIFSIVFRSFGQVSRWKAEGGFKGAGGARGAR